MDFIFDIVSTYLGFPTWKMILLPVLAWINIGVFVLAWRMRKREFYLASVVAAEGVLWKAFVLFWLMMLFWPYPQAPIFFMMNRRKNHGDA